MAITAFDPRSATELGSYAESAPEDVRRAASAARARFADPAFRDDATRARLLRAAARALRDAGDELRPLCEAETGLPEARVAGELERTCRQLEAFADVVDAAEHVEAIIDLPDPSSTPPRGDIRRMLIPIGPVAVFGASNFPFAFGVAGGDTASSLAAGCPVIAKGHPSHPGTNERVARALLEAGLDGGAFTLIQGTSNEIGEALVDAPEIEAVGFTGSLRGGRALYDRAAQREKPIPVYAEMGSVNPVVVTETALREGAESIADGLAVAVSGAAGQLCTKPGIVLVPDTEAGASFVAAVADRLAGGGPQPMLNERLRDSLSERLDEVVPHVETLRAGGPGDTGYTFAPAAFRTTARALRERPDLTDECFGPVVLFASYADDLEETLASFHGQLAASIHAAPDEAPAIAEILRERVGRLVFGGFSTGVAVCHAMQHGGPYPATTAPWSTSVGMTAIRRFLRPVAWQDAPAQALPPALRDGNPLGIWRLVNGELTRD
jgi:acyl-CoA reductase-like NAD-dependent aldehyde dehydrogenase